MNQQRTRNTQPTNNSSLAPDQSLSDQNFEQIFPFIMQNEGQKYTNDPVDNGGETKFGITQKTYNLHSTKNPTLFPQKKVKDLKIDEAKSVAYAIYKDFKCHQIKDSGLAYIVFDTRFSFSWASGKEILEKATGYQGNVMGALNTSNSNQEREGLITRIANERRQKYIEIIRKDPKQEKFRKGWFDRVKRVEKTAISRDFSVSSSNNNTSRFSNTSSKASKSTILSVGSRGSDVTRLQNHLVKNGYLDSPQVDGIFGSITEKAVKEYQRDHNLGIDGKVGNKTWQSIDRYNLPLKNLVSGPEASSELTCKDINFVKNCEFYGQIIQEKNLQTKNEKYPNIQDIIKSST